MDPLTSLLLPFILGGIQHLTHPSQLFSVQLQLSFLLLGLLSLGDLLCLRDLKCLHSVEPSDGGNLEPLDGWTMHAGGGGH